MNRIQDIYRKIINSLFGDVEVFFALPLRWKISGASAIGCLYLALVTMTFIALYPVYEAGLYSHTLLLVGYIFLCIGISVVLLPVFIPALQRHPLWVIVVSLIVLMVAFNIILTPILDSLHNPTVYALLIGFLAITFGARLYGRVIKEVTLEKTRIDTEIKLAQKIQTDLLPVIDIDEKYFQAFGKTVNAQEVGGDFFDVIKLNDTQLAFCVGDVSGHNIAAGLIMGIVKSAFRTELRYNNNILSIAASLNTTVIEQRSRGMFVSFAAGIIDFEKEELELINAGHPPVIQKERETIDELYLEGAALGLITRPSFQSIRRKISGGCIFVCYSDGIIESRNVYGEEFGRQRLTGLSRSIDRNKSPKEMYEIISRTVEEFGNRTPRIDDRTLLILRVK
jgi:serine phosphatase RsbU (regulator of sigma subunit)